jgi:hypothetical protein
MGSARACISSCVGQDLQARKSSDFRADAVPQGRQAPQTKVGKMINRRNILAAAVALAPTLAAAQPINVDPEGDVAHAAASARNQFNVRGAGIKVCVISYNDNGVDQAKGVYLPSSVDTVGGLHGPSAAAKDGEGAAMLEIVHRLAPDATLAFASGSPTPGADSDPAIENALPSSPMRIAKSSSMI